jgi:pimeloyl-ACP methyl ester carboxylesterase
MSEERMQVGRDRREIAVRRRTGRSPGLFWLGGFMSTMDGSKALAIDAFAEREGLAFTRFDYSAHGLSPGDFAEGTISRWLEEARAVFTTTAGPQIVIGSSMGGWIALLLAEAEKAPGRVAGLVLIAPAVDMTQALMWDKATRAQKKALMSDGFWREPSAYDPNGYVITHGLIEDGRRHLFGSRLIEPECPVHILQGMEDKEVPAAHSLALVSRLAGEDVVVTLIKDGDHRLSRPEDLERLTSAIAGVMAVGEERIAK